MKPPLSVVMVLFTAMSSVVIQTEAATRASAAVYGYCMGCTEWKEKNDNFLPATVKTTTPSVATYRSDFIPWPTTASLRLLSATPAVVPISKEKNRREVDIHASSMPLVTTKRLVSSSPTPQKDQLLESNLPNQQYEEESFLLLYVLVVAVAACVLTYAEKEDKLSSSDFDVLELTPTIDDEDEQEDISAVRTMETKSRSILVGSFSSEGKCVMRKQKAEKRVHFQDLPPQEEDSKSQRTVFFSPKASIPTPYDDCTTSMPLRYTCKNNNFQDMVSVEILKLLLEDPVEKSDTSAVMPNNFTSAAAENKEEEFQDVVQASSTTPKESDENEKNSSADSSMMNEYEDFLFQVRHSLQ